MTAPNLSKIESLFYKLALGSAIIVLFFSILNGYGFLFIIFRTALAFILMYFLGQILLLLWQSISPATSPIPNKEQKSSQFFDVMVGDEIDLSENNEETVNIENVNKSESLPGQIRMDLKNGLPEDVNARAELIRRMGWEENQE
ncbi:MAG: hypothetical protein APF84_15010 [Gracilibacter sp. BRH_c7a]|nr:MAG: hypothetical protein APF84_15010 [Gracilibacter sp. BRH_c7a]